MPKHRRSNDRALGFPRTVRFRLLLIALLPMLVVLPLLLGTTVANWVRRFDELSIAKVNSELTIAHQHLAGILETRGAGIVALGQSGAFERRIAAQDNAAVAVFLDQKRAELGLDFLYFMERGGRVTSSPHVGNPAGLEKWPVVQAALSGSHRAEIDIFEASDLAQFSPALAERASFALVPTEAAVPTERSEETRGMIVHAAAPAAGGALVGGLLLNRNLGFIDTINDLVYPAASLTEGSQGTATLFLEDVRISTNVRLFEDVRALGTRVSAVVRAAVLDEGRVWLDRAFVVNDWYVSAYEPIVDSYGKRVGMLYVGFLDTPFFEAKRQTVLTIAIAFFLIVLASVPIFLRWARAIFSPLERMTATIARVEAGDLGARSGVDSSDDEIGRVAAHLDTLLDQLQERDRRLRDWAEALESRVAERTHDLQEANKELEVTTRQLIVSEKLAAIGEITAGVAHEINNPVAVIQGNLEVIRDELGEGAKPWKTEFTLIQEQIQNVNILVSKLLEFARPEEYAGTVEGYNPDDAVRDSVPLVHHLLTKGDIEIVLNLSSQQTVSMNRTELQQVLVNLFVNAIQAMEDGGVLTVASRDMPRGEAPGVLIEVTDTGVGMQDTVLKRVFDPFYTTKRSEGTGLGLSISRKLIARVGGDITAESTPGKGTTFLIWLPAQGRP
ncbi:sensor histidine kinase [Actibacterium lipolyticum]|uniref:histidine kinase n=1 Tax=Actibacterium lipolyticum TaxID=1524263 RepID=A0A238KNJ3_9RHOB|nr:cache domain-containing protein [Actibacterium lipolyticum]SMX44298.1 Sporulation kinase E [Actibacterium lipolyticum]